MVHIDITLIAPRYCHFAGCELGQGCTSFMVFLLGLNIALSVFPYMLEPLAWTLSQLVSEVLI